jgi:acyl dehydratase
VLATPVAAAMLVRSRFPYPLLGVVHVRQSIRQRRPIALGETMAVRTWFGDEREVARGIEFETHVEIQCEGEPVWDGVSVALVRDRAKPRTKGGTSTSTARGLESTRIHVPANLGLRYARLTQDYNPIHLWPVTARMFGFARPIVHGMWSLARGLAEHQEKIPRGGFRLDCEFRKPVMLPGEVRLFHYEDETGWGFSMRDESGENKHLECNVCALERVPVR